MYIFNFLIIRKIVLYLGRFYLPRWRGIKGVEKKKKNMNTFNNNYYNKNLQPFANKLRHNMTKAEACLWKYALRASALGVPFRRERPIGRLIADFVCLPLKLVIEVDGATHLYEETQKKDAKKDKELKKMGFEVLRFQDSVILGDINFVTEIIRDKIEELKTLHPPNPRQRGRPIPQSFIGREDLFPTSAGGETQSPSLVGD